MLFLSLTHNSTQHADTTSALIWKFPRAGTPKSSNLLAEKAKIWQFPIAGTGTTQIWCFEALPVPRSRNSSKSIPSPLPGALAIPQPTCSSLCGPPRWALGIPPLGVGASHRDGKETDPRRSLCRHLGEVHPSHLVSHKATGKFQIQNSCPELPGKGGSEGGKQKVGRKESDGIVTVLEAELGLGGDTILQTDSCDYLWTLILMLSPFFQICLEVGWKLWGS